LSQWWKSRRSSRCHNFFAARREISRALPRLGYRIGGESGYLAARGLVQIATMGAVLATQIDGLFDSFDESALPLQASETPDEVEQFSA